jgi:hypothetical protein
MLGGGGLARHAQLFPELDARKLTPACIVPDPQYLGL